MMKLERYYDVNHNPVYTTLSQQGYPRSKFATLSNEDSYWMNTIAYSYHIDFNEAKSQILRDNDEFCLDLILSPDDYSNTTSRSFIIQDVKYIISQVKPLEEVAINLYELLGEK